MVRRDPRGRLARGGGLPGQGQDRLRRGAGSGDASSGWLYAWSWSIQQASDKKENAWKFISWASSKDYEELVGQTARLVEGPGGKRASTYENAHYLQEASAFAEPTKEAIETADPNNPGVQPRPAIGIQFIDIPEFPDLGTQVSQDVSSAIAGQMSVDEALDTGPASSPRTSPNATSPGRAVNRREVTGRHHPDTATQKPEGRLMSAGRVAAPALLR